MRRHGRRPSARRFFLLCFFWDCHPPRSNLRFEPVPISSRGCCSCPNRFCSRLASSQPLLHLGSSKHQLRPRPRSPCCLPLSPRFSCLFSFWILGLWIPSPLSPGGCLPPFLSIRTMRFLSFSSLGGEGFLLLLFRFFLCLLKSSSSVVTTPPRPPPRHDFFASNDCELSGCCLVPWIPGLCAAAGNQ